MISIHNMDTSRYIKKIKASQLKNTPKRRAVLELFLKGNRYLGPQDVKRILKNKFRSFGLPSTYRILEELSRSGILVRVEKDRQLYYALCRVPHTDHHHFICRKCRKVEEVECCNFKEIADFIKRKLNGKPESHSFQIEGLCSQCK